MYQLLERKNTRFANRLSRIKLDNNTSDKNSLIILIIYYVAILSCRSQNYKLGFNVD